MAFRKRKATRSVHYRPPLPPELAVYAGARWGAPSLDGSGNAWEAAHRAAYMRYEEAVRRWFTEFGHLAVDNITRRRTVLRCVRPLLRRSWLPPWSFNGPGCAARAPWHFRCQKIGRSS